MTGLRDAQTVATAQARLAELLPGEPLEPVRPLGAGLDHAAYLLGDVVVRFPARDGAEEAPDPRREAAILGATANVARIPVPQPLHATAAWIAYRRLPGTPLLDTPRTARAATAREVAATLGDLLGALWAVPRDALPAAVPDDPAPPTDWRAEAAAAVAEFAPHLSPPTRAALADFVAQPAPPPPPARVFSHNDLGAEHVLVDPSSGRVAGVIDWADAAVTDPAKDLGLILRDLGEEALAVAHARCVAALPAADPGLLARAVFYARCLALEDLAQGLAGGDERYSRNASAALDDLLGT